MKICKVMIVDDEITILEGFHKLFDWEAYNCEIVGDAMDGISAVQMADQRNPDLIIMDINIPMMNGIEAVRTIKAKHDKMQFIIVTGYDDFGYCQEALRLDVADYILKPVDFDELGTVIERVQKKMEAQGSWDVAKREAEGKIIYQIIGFLNEHIREDISLTMLSQKFHLNSSYISQLFKNELGVNYHAYLTQIRINNAKNYLKKTDIPIAEIADMVGFRDYRVFTRVFKAATGELPSQYRRKL